MKYPVQFTRISRPETIDQHSLLELIVVQMDLGTFIQNFFQIITGKMRIDFLCRIKIPEYPVKDNVLCFQRKFIQMMIIIDCMNTVSWLHIFQIFHLNVRIVLIPLLDSDLIDFLHLHPSFLYLVSMFPRASWSSDHIISMSYRTYP